MGLREPTREVPAPRCRGYTTQRASEGTGGGIPSSPRPEERRGSQACNQQAIRKCSKTARRAGCQLGSPARTPGDSHFNQLDQAPRVGHWRMPGAGENTCGSQGKAISEGTPARPQPSGTAKGRRGIGPQNWRTCLSEARQGALKSCARVRHSASCIALLGMGLHRL